MSAFPSRRAAIWTALAIALMLSAAVSFHAASYAKAECPGGVCTIQPECDASTPCQDTTKTCVDGQCVAALTGSNQNPPATSVAGLTTKSDFVAAVAARGAIDYSKFKPCVGGGPMAGFLKDGVRYAWCYQQAAKSLWYEGWSDSYGTTEEGGHVIEGSGLHGTILIFDAGTKTCGGGACQNPPTCPNCVQFLAGRYDADALPSSIVSNAVASLDGSGDVWWPVVRTGKAEVKGVDVTFYGELVQTAGVQNIYLTFEWGEGQCSPNSYAGKTMSAPGGYIMPVIRSFKENTQYKYKIRAHFDVDDWVYGEEKTFTTGTRDSTETVTFGDDGGEYGAGEGGTFNGGGNNGNGDGGTPSGGKTVEPAGDHKGKCPGTLGSLIGGAKGCACYNEDYCSQGVLGVFLWCGGKGPGCAAGHACFEKDGAYGCWPVKGFESCSQAFSDFKALIRVYDANGNSMLEDSEHSKAMEDWQNGKMAQAKYSVLNEYWKQKCKGSGDADCKEISTHAAELAKYDLNGDSFISADEFEKAKAAWKDMTGTAPVGGGSGGCPGGNCGGGGGGGTTTFSVGELIDAGRNIWNILAGNTCDPAKDTGTKCDKDGKRLLECKDGVWTDIGECPVVAPRCPNIGDGEMCPIGCKITCYCNAAGGPASVEEGQYCGTKPANPPPISGCMDNSQCSGSTPVCGDGTDKCSTIGKCVQCNYDSSCDITAGEVCQGCQCVQSQSGPIGECDNSADCNSQDRPYCCFMTGLKCPTLWECVQCYQDSQCGSSEECKDGACAAKVTGNIITGDATTGKIIDAGDSGGSTTNKCPDLENGGKCPSNCDGFCNCAALLAPESTPPGGICETSADNNPPANTPPTTADATNCVKEGGRCSASSKCCSGLSCGTSDTGSESVCKASGGTKTIACDPPCDASKNKKCDTTTGTCVDKNFWDNALDFLRGVNVSASVGGGGSGSSSGADGTASTAAYTGPSTEVMGLLARAMALKCNLKTGQGNLPGQTTPGSDGTPGGCTGAGCGGSGGGAGNQSRPPGTPDRWGRSCLLSPKAVTVRASCGGVANFTIKVTGLNDSSAVSVDCGGGQAGAVSCDSSKCSFSCTYPEAGNYTARASIASVESAVDCGSSSVTSRPPGKAPIADFAWTPEKPLPGTNVTFDANRSWDQDGEGITEYIWDFNSDGTTDATTGLNVLMHTFERGGRYNVTLTVKDVECLTNSTTKTVDVAVPVNLRLISATDEGPGQRVCFALDVPLNYSANYINIAFGDGDSYREESAPERICHFYMPGRYNASVGVMFSDGLFSRAWLNVSVTVGLCPPILDFTFYPDVPGIGDAVRFDASRSMDLDGGRIETYAWAFGDGRTASSSSPRADHVYAASGTYVVTLTATDDDGQTNTMAKAITVSAQSVDLTVLGVSPREHAVDVEFGIHVPSGSEISSMELDFGDRTDRFASAAPQGRVNHSYGASGTYTAKLRVAFRGALGNSVGEDSENVTVSVLAEGIWILITDRKGAYMAGENLSGSVETRYSRVIPSPSAMKASIDGTQKDQMDLASQIRSPEQADYRQHKFKYRITATGETRRLNATAYAFNYTIMANGTCGSSACAGAGCSCPCSPPYPCQWETRYSGSSSVRASDGLKSVYNGQASISPPADANNGTAWTELTNGNANVRTTMRMACGSEAYAGVQTDANGWVHRAITSGELAPVAGTADRETLIETFDGASLFPPARFSERGGVYKNGVYQEFNVGAKWESDRNGHGYVRILNYDATAAYEIAYLPPAGTKLCAYALAVQSSEPWERSFEEERTLTYGEPFSRTYTDDDLARTLNVPACTGSCQTYIHAYTVTKTQDADNAISLSSSRNTTQKTLTISAAATALMLSRNYTFSLDFANFRNLQAPQATGTHTLAFTIADGNATLSSASKAFTTCADVDKDGYCAGTGPSRDCDDLDADVHPGASEKCNGRDDDCDGAVDEDFWGTIAKLGEYCGTGSCSGTYVCNKEGVRAVCSGASGGHEVCGNFADDDCDGLTDEDECGCVEGLTKACGTSRGECKAGMMTCVGGQWTACRGETGPGEEACNRKDDDCDGIVDNVGGGKSAEATKCGCFKGAPPEKETCNGIDDDCDGRVDESLTCCSEGDTRSCSDALGACTGGTQACEGGAWAACSIKPAFEETCWNSIDDNCNGEVDENCGEPPATTPTQGDSGLMWYVIAGLAVVVGAGAGMLYLTGRL